MNQEKTIEKLLALRERAACTSYPEGLRQIFEELDGLMEHRLSESRKSSGLVGKADGDEEKPPRSHFFNDQQIRTDILFSINLCLGALGAQR